ncbi:MAG: hypothetical protein HP491_01665 [Nitrospira sp.]|nr:hypothetical protein [Nitrospira sp.]
MESATNEQPKIQLAPVEGPESHSATTPPAGGESFWRASMIWFFSLTIERRILAGFSLVFAGILVISTVSYRNTSMVIANSGLDTRSHELVQLLTNIDMAMDQTENNHRRYLVTGEEVMILWIGLYPSPFLRIMNGSVQALVDRLNHGTVAALGTSTAEKGR